MSESRFKILLLSSVGSFHTERYYNELTRQGCEVLLASVENGSIEHTPLVRMTGLANIDYYLSIGRVKKLIAEFQPQVVCAHYACGYGMLAARAMKNISLPLVLVLWGSDVLIVPKRSAYQRGKTVTALKRADLVYGDSHYLLDQAAKLHSMRKSAVAQWGIEREYLSLHKKNYDLSKPLRIIVPRLQEPVYNNSFIIEALSDLLKDGNVKLTLAGFGSRLETIKLECTRFGDAVTFYPKQTRTDFLKLMAEHDVYLSASRSDSSPVSLIEAMALGLIPVAANIDGVHEWLTDATGLLFPQDDKTALLNTIKKLVDDDNAYEQMRISNLELVKERAIFEKSMAEQIATMKEMAG